MKRLLSLLFLVLLVVSGCGSDSSSDSDSVVGFTSSMIDDDTYYLTYEENDNTVQSTIVFSSTVATVTDEWYDADGVFHFRGSYGLTITLNDDGSLTASSSSDADDTLTETSDYTIEWSYDSETWVDDWAYELPDDWYTTEEFTADMIDDDVYYLLYEDGFYTAQETITFSGTQLTVFKEYILAVDGYETYDGEDYNEETTYSVTLNDDGSLTATSDEGSETMILVSSADTGYAVYVADEDYTYTGTDDWYISQPSDWIY
jgi:hypothetical protein